MLSKLLSKYQGNPKEIPRKKAKKPPSLKSLVSAKMAVADITTGKSRKKVLKPFGVSQTNPNRLLSSTLSGF